MAQVLSALRYATLIKSKLLVTGSQTDYLLARTLRKELSQVISCLEPLNHEQAKLLEVLLGEALTNAFEHSLRRRSVGLKLSFGADCQAVIVRITNPSHGFPEGPPQLPPDSDSSEGGRGRYLMSGIAQELSFLGVPTRCSYSFSRRNNTGCTTFELYLHC